MHSQIGLAAEVMWHAVVMSQANKNKRVVEGQLRSLYLKGISYDSFIFSLNTLITYSISKGTLWASLYLNGAYSSFIYKNSIIYTKSIIQSSSTIYHSKEHKTAV